MRLGQVVTAVLLVPLLVGMFAMSVAIIAITRNQLYVLSGFCSYYWGGRWANTCVWLWEGCYASDAINDIQPCRYSYGVGAVGMVLAMIAITCQFCGMGTIIANLISGACNIVWWAVAGQYFTEKYNRGRSAPQSYWRHVTMALMWTCLAISAVQFLAGIAGIFLLRAGDVSVPSGPQGGPAQGQGKQAAGGDEAHKAEQA